MNAWKKVEDDARQALLAAGWPEEALVPQEGPREVTPEMMSALVGAWCEADEASGFLGRVDLGCCQGAFWCRQEDGSVTAADNTAGACLVEGFATKLEALDWLADGTTPELTQPRPLSALSQDELEEAWQRFGDVPIDEADRLLEGWRGYPSGTDRFEVWHDFDEASEGGVYALAFPGDASANESLSMQRSAALSACEEPVGAQGERRDLSSLPEI